MNIIPPPIETSPETRRLMAESHRRFLEGQAEIRKKPPEYRPTSPKEEYYHILRTLNRARQEFLAKGGSFNDPHMPNFSEQDLERLKILRQHITR